MTGQGRPHPVHSRGMTLSFPASRPNAYTGSPIDRAGHHREDAEWIARALDSPDALFAPVWRARSLMRGLESGAPEAVLLGGEAVRPLHDLGCPWAFMGLMEQRPVFAIDISHEDPPPIPGDAGAFTDLRQVAGLLPAGEASVLAHARGLMHWRVKHRFCGVCGGRFEPRSAGHAMACTNCGAQHFPRTDPAVIMLVVRGGRCLLGHNLRFPTPMYSTLAGFVEPGESLEEAVRREVMEEAGIAVGQVVYHSSQPWPFPASIMLGFHAEGLTEDIHIDREELRDARWFSRRELHDHKELGFDLPRADSIARRLIEDWLHA